MTPKEYLQQAYKIDRKIKLNLLKMQSMKDALHGRAVSYESDGSQHVSQGNAIENAILRVMEYEEQIDTEIDKLTEKRQEIERVIASVPDDVQREILTRRYLGYQDFESHYDKRTGKYIVGIDEDTGYSARQVYRIHWRGLQSVKTILERCQ